MVEDKRDDRLFYLLDLERSITSGRTFYWNQHKRGYTINIDSAGVFKDIQSQAIVDSDFDKRTIRIEKRIADKIRERS